MGGSSKKVTVGYKYYLGMHMILCHGPVDKIVRIRVDGRDAWVGNRRAGRININQPSLFGGESREGGIVGGIDFMPGEPTQGVNDYLASRLGSLVPAFRGVVGVVLRQVYIGLNPYLKKWDFRVSRVMTRQDGIPQWYPQTASIPTAEAFKVRQRILFAIDDSGSMNQIVSGSRTRLDVMKDNMANVLDEIKILKTDSQVPVDLAVVKLNGGSISYADASPTQIDAVKAYILNMTASGNTPFQGAFSYAKSWFSAHSGERRNVMVLISDGEPWPLEDFPAAVAEAAPILNRTGTWSGNNEVDVYAVNIDLGNTFYSQQLDNTPGDGVPVVDGSSSDELYNAVFFAFMGDSPAMNVVHAVRECLTDPTWGMGYAESDIDEASFRAAALRLRQERLGICLLWDRQKPIEDMIQELLKHADAALYVDRKTGLFKIKLIRDGYDTATLLHLTEENIVKIENFSRPSFGELTTSVTVNYWNVTTGSNASVTVQDIALASMQQAHVATTLQYPGLPDAVMASRVAQRSLKVLSSQLARCAIYADRSAKDVAIGDVVKVTWPEYDLQETVFRVIEVAYGDGRSNRIKLTVIEDSFGMPETAYVAPSEPEWENPSQAPQPITRQVAFEAPYLELVQRQSQDVVNLLLSTNPDAGYVGAAGVSPGGAAINARTYTNNGSGYEDIGVMDFSPGASLAVAVDQMEETFMLAQGSALDLVNAGTWGQIDEELFAVVGISGNVMTVKRGVLDTAVRPHAEGAPIIFWDESSTVDDTEYVTSEQVAVKLATVSGSGELPLEQATEMSVTMRGRANRPYPPGDMKLNGEYFPSEIIGNAPVEITFATRNRLQQTGGSLLGFTDASVTPEDGEDYVVEAYQSGTSDLIYNTTGLGSPIVIPENSLTVVPEVDLRLYSRRGSLLSYQYQLATVLTGGLAIPWEPSMLPNLVVWYDADSPDNTLVSGLMDTLYDRSGNGNHAPKWNNDNTNRAQVYDNALNGRRVWGYDTTSRKAFFASDAAHVKAAGNLAHGLSIFTVSATVTDQGTSDAGTVASITIGTSNSSTRCQVARGFVAVNGIYTGGRRLDTDTNANTSDSVNYGTGYRIAGGVNDYLNRRSTLYVDGAQVAQNTTFQTIGYTSATDAQFFLVGGTGAGFNPHRGRTAEVVLCRGVLPNDDRQKLEGYLAHRWGLAAQLPSNHPYKAAAPTVNLVDGELPPNLIAPRAITEAP